MFPFISISWGTSVPLAGLDVLFVKQWYTTAPNRLPTKNDTTEEEMVDTAIAIPAFSGPAVIPENIMQSHTHTHKKIYSPSYEPYFWFKGHIILPSQSCVMNEYSHLNTWFIHDSLTWMFNMNVIPVLVLSALMGKSDKNANKSQLGQCQWCDLCTVKPNNGPSEKQTTCLLYSGQITCPRLISP